MSEAFFALDIGTRKVMGIVARKSGNGLDILDAEVAEHPGRAMFDGQIHHIDEVAGTVRLIKERLQSRLQSTFTHVGVAVAGRDLVTFRGRIEKEFEAACVVTQEMVRDIEFEAIEKIMTGSGADLSQYYCVGYSPVYHALDGSRLASLVGHTGKRVAAEVIATFLPRIVLDGMFSVLKKAGLEAVSITLEPIAALRAIIPSEIRNLNVILVDIGAGTSDLSVVKDGVVSDYGMVPEAGDEITECISHHLLVDFTEAERIKRAIGQEKSMQYRDIWGKVHQVTSSQASAIIFPAVKKLAESIAKAGTELNGASPQAVVLVGGGSRTYGIIPAIAEAFAIPPDSVGVRLPVMIDGIRGATGILTGPEAVTPIGITLMTEDSSGLRFITVSINGQPVTVLDFQQKKNILGVLTLAGTMNKKKLHPRPGMALTVEVDGSLRVIKGTLGSPAQVFVNGQLVTSLSHRIEDKDVIEFVEAQDGQDAVCLVRDVIDRKPMRIIFNQKDTEAYPRIVMDGKETGGESRVVDRAHLQVMPLCIRDFLGSQGVNLDAITEREVLININGTPKILTQRNCSIAVNGRPAELSYELHHNDIVEYCPDKPSCYRINDVVDFPDAVDELHITVNDQAITVKIESVQIFMNGQRVNPEEFVINGADIRVYFPKNKQIILSEIFRYIDFDPAKVLGKKFTILVDEKPAGFTTPLADGAIVKLLVEDRKNESA